LAADLFSLSTVYFLMSFLSCGLNMETIFLWSVYTLNGFSDKRRCLCLSKAWIIR
jgi:hypothetical protein